MRDNAHYLKFYQEGKKIQKVILETIEDCRKWKNIDAKFTKKLKEKGVNASISNDPFGYKVFKVYTWIDGYAETIIHSYIKCNDWKIFQARICETNWNDLIKETHERIDSLEKEMKSLEILVHNLRNMKFKNFSLSKAIGELESQLKEIYKINSLI